MCVLRITLLDVHLRAVICISQDPQIKQTATSRTHRLAELLLMRLINTTTFRLKSFPSPEDVPGGYVILSHCWEDEEQSFQHLERINEQCADNGRDARQYICEKIVRLCDFARTHRYDWAWIDTCCIDKTSSAELSEAINSMHRYYSLAALCYAFLADVPSVDAFEGSRWHTRGWTLQELVAPHIVVFLSASWDVLGTKADLALQLTRCTRIPAAILRHDKRPADVSIAQRMSWAANRRTTRVEDEAYCLLGIFDINMPTLYGEGRKAFRRLQEEIMKTSADTTLHAWHARGDTYPGFFAPSSEAFLRTGDIQYTPRFRKRPWYERYARSQVRDITPFTLGLPDFVPAKVWTVKKSSDLYADLGWSMGDPAEPMFLRLRKPSNPTQSAVYFLAGPVSRIEWPFIQLLLKRFKYRHILVPVDPTLSSQHAQTVSIPMNLNWTPSIRVSDRARGNIVAAINVDAPLTAHSPMALTVTDTFKHYTITTLVQIGRCTSGTSCAASSSSSSISTASESSSSSAWPTGAGYSTRELRSIWANVQDPRAADNEHACPADHILSWRWLTRGFTLAVRLPQGFHRIVTVQLQFRRCRLTPERTLVLDDVRIVSAR
ncbi:heterokaryon incompatibility protein-domain-containing protein [Fomes fomentarius]|nr:heterokaryon incompatibility protein-domain-containing protein [Fomes fomentarius]